MIRDKIKTVEYYTAFLEEERNRIKKFEDKLKEGSIAEDRIKPVLNKIASLKFGCMVGMYSSGASKDDIIKSYNDVITYFETVWNPAGGYIDMVWMLSIGIMIDSSHTEIEKLIGLVDKNNIKDYLLDFLISHWRSDRLLSENVLFPKPYKSLIDVIRTTDAVEASRKLKYYLEKEWYKGHSDAGWHDTHKSDEKLYSGYWSFESGALAKVLGLDDHAFKDNQYYPYDMVHWK